MAYLKIVAFTLVCILLTGLAGCGAVTPDGGSAEGTPYRATDLMAGVSPGVVNNRTADEAFAASMADFALKLFHQSITAGENSMVSPLSVMLALAMTANGADNETLAQMEALLGGPIPLDRLNEYLRSYSKALPDTDKSRLAIANSIWFRDDGSLRVEPGFLQRNADYYGAAAYGAPFDGTTVRDINSWVSRKTDGMIGRIVDRLADDIVMILINAILFDAEWESMYRDNAVQKASSPTSKDAGRPWISCTPKKGCTSTMARRPAS